TSVVRRTSLMAAHLGGSPPRNDGCQGTLRSSALTTVGGRGDAEDGLRTGRACHDPPPTAAEESGRAASPPGRPPRNDGCQGTLRSSALTTVGGRGDAEDGLRTGRACH